MEAVRFRGFLRFFLYNVDRKLEDNTGLTGLDYPLLVASTGYAQLGLLRLSSIKICPFDSGLRFQGHS